MNGLKIKAIAFFINKSDSVIDIGCDHAYLPIYLEKNKLCKKVIASDINEGALNNAISNIEKNRLSKKIKSILSDGLNEVDVKGINTAVLAGMGFRTIKHILDNKEKFKKINKIIISSNNDWYLLRKYMQRNGYKLDKERIIYEKGHYYIICKYIKGKQKLSKKEYIFGLYNKENLNYYKYMFKENKRILKKIPITKIKTRRKLKKQNKILKKYIKIK